MRWILDRSLAAALCLVLFSLASISCSPKAGSDAWCKKMKETPKADWTANDATSFAKHCIFK